MKWKSNLYDNSQGFVSEYGKDLIQYIPKDENLKILDLGCGTGDLTYQISELCSKNINGSDFSNEMIIKAKEKYSNIDFSVCDACSLPYDNEYDIIFSNAVFHWISDQNKLHQSIYKSLKKDGILICEFGGYKNIDKITQSYQKAVQTLNDSYTSPFYFPSIEEHTKILENNGFHIELIYDFDRPTPLPNEELGLRNWINQFFSSHLSKFTIENQDSILNLIEADLKPTMYIDGKWIADYRRLRVVAIKNM